MITGLHFRNDAKQIMRDTIMTLMMFAPLLLTVVVKLMVIYLVPFIASKTGIDASQYYQYVLASTMIINASMMGIVIGFMMIDERDSSITQLMAVTPLGRSGYLINRLSLIVITTLFYNIFAHIILGIVQIPMLSVLHLVVLSAIYSAIVGLLLYLGAEDKVKGLTFAKGLNVMILFIFSDLFSLKWLTAISWIFPTYWFSGALKTPTSIFTNVMAFLVSSIWLGVLIYRFWKRET